MSASEELRVAETVAAGLNRGLNVEPMRWSELLAIAQRELNDYQRRTHLARASELYEEELATPLIAAARIILEVATRQTLESDADSILEVNAGQSEDASERHLLLILASCAFAMYGNFPSAAAVQRKIDFRFIRSEAQWLALAVCNPGLLSKALISSFVTDAGREFLERFNMFLVTGDEVESERLIAHFEEFLLQQHSLSDLTFLRGARLALKHSTNLAVSRLRRTIRNDIFHEYIKLMIADKRQCLLPPQYNVISDGFLRSNNNSILTIPTSTGKTLLAELAIAARMQGSGDVSIYVCPYVALGRQVFESFTKHSPKSVNVYGYFGNFNSKMQILPYDSSNIIVATPERVDAILRSYDIYSRVTTIVFDEAHGIENGIRGVRLEALITRLRLQQEQGRNFRLILLSAVLADVEALQEWLGSDSDHYEDSWRPTTRRLAIWTTDGKLGWIYGGDPLRPASKDGASYLGRKSLEWPEEMWPTDHYGGMAAQKSAAYDNVAFLARHVRSSIGGPVMIACYARQTTRGVASTIAAKLPESEDLSQDQDRLLAALRRYPHLETLAKMVRKGVAYHNASLPGEIKMLIENAVRSRSLDFISATTTLAEGVDLPFRCTILFDWLIGFGIEQAPMSSLLFRNIAGRCGRAGEFTEGDTIIFDNVLGNMTFVRDKNRRRAQLQLISDPPPLRSVVANDNLGEEEIASVRAVLSSQLMAAIPENPADAAIEQTLAGALYAAHCGTLANELFADLRSELLNDSDGEPFAKAASPLSLTPLGQAANRTGFGPRTCRAMLHYLQTMEEGLSATDVGAALLVAFGDIEEQNHYVLREVVSGRKSSRLFVRSGDLDMLANGWLDGTHLVDLFVALPKALSSKAAVPPTRWATGEAENEFVANQYDKFVDLMEYAFGSYLPWLIRALATLSVVAPRQPDYPWAEFADQYETCRIDAEGAIDGSVVDGPTE